MGLLKMKWIKKVAVMFSLCVFFINSTVTAETLTLTEINSLKANPANGKDAYLTCALCHSPQGWGTSDGYYPQLSGQLPNVLIKQLLDIKQGNRDVPTMIPFADAITSQNAQNAADLVAYISALPMHPENTRGKGDDLTRGKKLYVQGCQSCHGENAEGNNTKNYPLLQGQNYQYLLRQLQWFNQGKRKNGNDKMLKAISAFTDKDMQAVTDYISRIKPAANKLAENTAWKNPDFHVNFVSTPWLLRNQLQKDKSQ